jgi:predicted phage-related endonuclease
MNATILPGGLLSRTETYPTRAAWLTGRGSGVHRIGASDVAGILGLPAFRTGWDLSTATGSTP